jgi:hypothetical protein
MVLVGPLPTIHWGNFVPLQQHPPPDQGPPPPNGVYGPSYGGGGSGFANANDYSTGCYMDGLPASCTDVARALDNGNAGVDKNTPLPGPGGAAGGFTPTTVTKTSQWTPDGIIDTEQPGGEPGTNIGGPNWTSWTETTWVRVPGNADDGNQQNPQKTLPTDLKDQVTKIAAGCPKNYMDRLLKQLGSKFTAATYGDLFDRVGMDHIKIDHQQFVDAGDATAAGLAKDNPRRIYINTGVTAIARVTTFELLHHAKGSGTYSDKEVDKAVIGLMDAAAQRVADRERKSGGYRDAMIAHKELNTNCFNPQKV